MNDNLMNQMNSFVEEDIQHELKNLKAKYEKARRDYDSACSKVTNLRSKKNLDILKLYAVIFFILIFQIAYVCVIQRLKKRQLKQRLNIIRPWMPH